jgi:hypothetical protein
MYRLPRIALGALLCLLFVTTRPAQADDIPLSTVTRIATFDGVVTGVDLRGYVEDGLRISVPGVAYTGFDPTGGLGGFSGGYYYASQGAEAFTTIAPSDGSSMFALDFNVGSGWAWLRPVAYIHFEVMRGGDVFVSRTFQTANGSVIGYRDPRGFDELRIGAYFSLADAQAATPHSFQGVALDNVRAVTGSAPPVPEPATLFLLSTGALGMTRRAWKRRAQAGNNWEPQT